MSQRTALPECFPAETKYVLEARGNVVYRHVEFPNGERLELEPRKALTCRCLALREQDARKHRKSGQAAA